MPRIPYVSKNFRDEALQLIEECNRLVAYYDTLGLILSLRQLYYRLVDGKWLPNRVASYAKLGNLVSDARLAGLMDWQAIEDRQRELFGLPETWDDETNILEWARDQFKVNRWHYNRKYRLEVWVEKASLLGVLERPCRDLYVSFFTTRGYNSQTEMWNAAQRFIEDNDAGLEPVLLYLGDHDPSGIDMGRDIQDRLALFGADVRFERIALNMAQVQQYNLAPDPAKVTDSRYEAYQRQYGTESWEVDALDPPILDALIRQNIERFIDQSAWDQAEKEEQEGQERFTRLVEHWPAVKDYLRWYNKSAEHEDPDVLLLGPAP